VADKPILIPGDEGYSHAHYWRVRDNDEDPREGLCELAGCRTPAEPGTPWCNRHTHEWLAAAKAAGYASAEQIRWAAEQAKLPALFADALVRRWERFFPTTKRRMK